MTGTTPRDAHPHQHAHARAASTIATFLEFERENEAAGQLGSPALP